MASMADAQSLSLSTAIGNLKVINEGASMDGVVMLIITQSIETDDRLRKTCHSVERQLCPVKILSIERAYREGREGITAYGIQFRSLSTLFGRLFEPKKGIVLKGVESIVKFMIGHWRMPSDVMWVHDPGLWPLVLWGQLLRRCGRIKKLVWDLHELPDHGPGGYRGLGVRRALRAADMVITTNGWRKKHLVSTFDVPDNRVKCVENYTDAAVASLPVAPLPQDLLQWLSRRPYILAQGGAGSMRHDDHLVAAAMALGIPVVFIGKRYEGAATDMVYNTGWIPQEQIYRYIDHAAFSAIFYRESEPNTIYCSPNRLYQALARGCPVVVGRNPPMEAVVSATRAGLVAATDGQDVDAIIAAFKSLMEDRVAYREYAMSARNVYSWEQQFDSVLDDVGQCPEER